ncbi:MAG: MDR family MFS transporter [Spirochaetales bacterium]
MTQTLPAPGELSAQRKRWVLIGVLVGMFLGSLTGTIISTAMPRILADLQGMEYISWAMTAYMLTSTLAMPIFGKLADMYGRKWFYLGGIAIFLVGSILCGFATDMTQFIAFRAVAGIGGGIMQAIAMTIIADLFPPAERGKYQGLLGGVFGLASVIGPLLGGWITDNMTWNWVFWVNLPVGITALVILGLGLPAVNKHYLTPSAQKPRIDWWGIVFQILAFTPMLVAFSWAGSKYEWLSPEILSLLGFSLVMVVIFLVVESKAQEPIVPLSLFRNGIFNVSVITGFLMSIGMFGGIMYLPMFLQGVVGQTATNSGLAMAPMMVALIIASAVGGQLVSRTGRYKIVGLVGFSLMLLAEILFSLMTVQSDGLTVSIDMIVMGLGLGLCMPVFVVACQSAFPHKQVGVVTSSLQFFRSIGGTFGIALMGSLLNSQFKVEAAAALPASIAKLIPADKRDQFLTPQALFSPSTKTSFEAKAAAFPGGKDLVDTMFTSFKQAFADSVHHIFFISIFIVAAALLVTFFLKEIPLRKTNRPAAEEAGAELLAEGVAGPGPIPAEFEPDLGEGTTEEGAAGPSTRKTRK